MQQPRTAQHRFVAWHCAALLLLASVLGAPHAAAQGTLKAQYGDWQHRCDASQSGKGEQCILIQNVVDQSGLNVAVVVLKVEDGAATIERRKKDPNAAAVRRPVLRIIVPLGVLLPRRLGLKIDEREIGATEFIRCLESGCVAEVDLEGGLLEGFKRGKIALFSLFLTPDEGRGMPVTLPGFESGYAAIQ